MDCQHSKRRRSSFSLPNTELPAQEARDFNLLHEDINQELYLTMLRIELNQLMNLLKTAGHFATTRAFVMRRKVLIVGFFAYSLFAGKDIVEARLPLSSLSYLRGGHSSFVPSSTTHLEVKRGRPRGRVPLGLGDLQRSIDVIGNKIQVEAQKHWSGFHKNLEREWSKVTLTIVKLLSRRERHGTGKLDNVLRAFASVLNGNEVDTAQLIKACRAHLILMKSGGAALRLVANDLEANLNKAESLFEKLEPKDGKSLASLLEVERKSGIHDGNMLKEDSAAMGLLWIRRSLAFQKNLYASLIPNNGRHPRDSAVQAYDATLSPYHGWLLRKIFPASLSQMPDRRVFIAKFGGTEVDKLNEELEREIVKKLKLLISTWEPMLNTWRNEFKRLDLEDIRRA